MRFLENLLILQQNRPRRKQTVFTREQAVLLSKHALSSSRQAVLACKQGSHATKQMVFHTGLNVFGADPVLFASQQSEQSSELTRSRLRQAIAGSKNGSLFARQSFEILVETICEWMFERAEVQTFRCENVSSRRETR